MFQENSKVSPDAGRVSLQPSPVGENRPPVQRQQRFGLPTQQQIISPSTASGPTWAEIMQAEKNKHEQLMQEARKARMAESERLFKAREEAREAEKERRFRAREAEKDRQLIRDINR
jgi:hypothetical protein